jgi:glycosyltransferase involved in cell wall biosynthesis
MRVLVTLDNWSLIGGSERYAGDIVNALAARSHAVQVLCGAAPAPRLALPPGCELLVDPNYSDARATASELGRLARTARAASPEVLFMLSCFQASSFRALERVAPIVRFVQDHTLFCPSLNKIWSDGENCANAFGSVCLERYFKGPGCSCFRQAGRVSPWIEGVGEFKKKFFEFESAKRTRRTIVASRYMKSELVAAGDAPDHVAVIPYFTRANSAAIPPATLSDRTKNFLAASDAPLVFTPARLALPDKGLDVLLAALARVKSPLRAVIAGDGPARAWLEAKAGAEGLNSRVHFAGWQSAGQIETLYERARAVVFPSTWKEPFGLVGIEAMSHAKPVVAFDVGGVGEWLEHERAGYLLRRGDVQAMSSAIDALCRDPELAARLGAAGRERARREFGEAAHVARIEKELLSAAS